MTSQHPQPSAFRYAPIEVVDRFVVKIDATETCWNWTAALTRANGYGSFQLHRRPALAHRLAYSWATGSEIPKGMQIDHLCRNPRCVNPAHLEVVTPQVNTLRSTNPPATNAQKTHCINGHEFTTENTYVYSGRRACRICKRARWLAKYWADVERSRNRDRARRARRKAQKGSNHVATS